LIHFYKRLNNKYSKMPPRPSDTPPASPSIISTEEEEEEELYDDEVLEEVPIDYDAAPPLEDEQDQNIEDGEEEEELVELPGGLDQLESIIENYNAAKDNSYKVFKEHGKSVFTCDFHPSEPDICVSGGEDDRAFIWNTKTEEIIHKLEDWNDSVISVKWSSDGQYLAACDMAGHIKVYKYPGFSLVWSFEVGDINWLKWHPVANVLFCGTADSEMWMWKIPSGDSKIFQGQGEKTECGEILTDGRKAVCGYSDGSLRLFDLKNGNTLHTLSKGQGVYQAHGDSVNCVASHPANTVFISGSMDGTAKLWNPSTGKIVATLLCGSKEEENSSSSVECAIFPKEKTTTYCVTGTLDGVVTVWDTPTQISRHACKVGEGVTKLVLHPDGNLIYASTLDGDIKCLDLRTGNSVRELIGHKESILDFSISSNGKDLLSSSDDGTCRVFDISDTT